ncbi:tetratricopeptide repeat protein [bacterium]|nr:tetratricopeptide repeat protein [bacterium]
MKIMLIQVEPADDIQDFNFPMGYAALDSVLTKHGHEVELMFTVAYHLSDQDIIKKVKESKAQIIGLGGMFPYLQRAEMLVKLIREARPDVKIVLGGWMVTYVPQLVLQKTSADFLIRGEGEIAFLKLVNCLENNSDYSEIKGLVCKEGNNIVDNGLGEVMQFEDIPMPNWEKFPMEYYMRTGWYFNSFATGYDRIIGWAASRGCPGKCNFCTPGVSVRYKNMDLLMKELHEIEDKFHPTFIYWMDNLTMGSKSYCKKFCQALIKEDFKFRYFITGRADMVDREMLQLLKESGCVCILYGLESANNDLLAFMKKNIKVEQVIEAVRLTKEAGIGVNISAMFGQPGETIQDFYNTVKIIMMSSDRKNPYSNNQGFYPLTTFPGSPIFYWAKDNTYIKDDEDYYNQFFSRRWINYTQYPREVVEKVLAAANLLNTWNYHRSKVLSLEDSLFYTRVVSSSSWSKMPIKKLVYKLKDYIGGRPRLKSSAKQFLESQPRFKRWVTNLLEPNRIDSGVTIPSAVKPETENFSIVSVTPIDPQWDPQRQADEFIDRLIRDYFIGGGNESLLLKEEAEHLSVLAKAHYDRRNYEDAIKYYNRVVQLVPNDDIACGMLGWAYQHTMRYDEAIKAFNEAVKINNTTQLAFRGLGWANYQKGFFDAAVQNFNKALELISPHEKDFLQETYRGRAWSYYNMNKFEEAKADFENAIRYTDSNNKAILEDLYNGQRLSKENAILGR